MEMRERRVQNADSAYSVSRWPAMIVISARIAWLTVLPAQSVRNAPTVALTRFVKTVAFVGIARLSVSAVKAPVRSALYFATTAVNTVKTVQYFAQTAVFVRIAPSFAKSVDFARAVLSSATTAVPVKIV